MVVDALDPDYVILKIKFDEFLPDIIKQLLSINDTRKTAFSKYQLSRRFG
ncbi:VTC domain-containing protein [Bacillus sp. ISL-4]